MITMARRVTFALAVLRRRAQCQRPIPMMPRALARTSSLVSYGEQSTDPMNEIKRSVMGRTCSFLSLLFLLPSMAWGQYGQELHKMIDPVNNNGWMELKDKTNIDASTIFETYRDEFGIGEDDEMVLLRAETDAIGFTHHRYRQYYKGIRIEGAEFIVHERDDRSVKANGVIVTGLDLGTTPSISANGALAIAMDSLPATEYMWEDTATENRLKTIKSDSAATYYPSATLLITKLVDSMGFDTSNLVLAYKIGLRGKTPRFAYWIYLNANTGAEIKRHSLFQKCTPGSACTLYNSHDGPQAIKTNVDPGTGQYRLWDDCRGGGIRTVDFRTFMNPYFNFGEILNTSTMWTTNCGYTQAHWAGEMTYDYFLERHNRNSHDNNGGIMVQQVGSYQSAYDPTIDMTEYLVPEFWPLDCPQIGCGEWQTSLDIVGHEWTHAVVQFSSGPEYGPSESGALNESFCDIFGSMVECYAKELYNTSHPDDCEDFTIAEGLMPQGGTLRSMCNPKLYGNPDTYNGVHWFGSEDPHHRSGVQNKWFCLLAKGGSGTNDHGYNYILSGIGKEKAAAIAYRNLTTYLTPSSIYADARQGAIESARDLYGNCSDEVKQTIEAWNAVGVLTPGIQDDLTVCDNVPEAAMGPEVPRNVYIAREWISAGCLSEAGHTTILPDFAVVFKAGDRIYLGPGFHAPSGSYFHAYIFSCPDGPSQYAISDGSDGGVDTEEQYGPPPLGHDADRTVSMSSRPNPFNSETELIIQFNEPRDAEIVLYDLYGRAMRSVANRLSYMEGSYSIVLHKNELASGTYYCVLRSDRETVVHRLIIM